MEAWKVVLYQYSAQASFSLHVVGFSWQKHRKYSSTLLFTTSDCPSFCGWQIVLLFNWVPCKRKISFQKWLKNIRSLPDTMERGYPWRQTTSFMNNVATVLAENGCSNVKKWAYLLRRSTTTRIVSNPLDRDKPSIESIDISSQILLGMGRGCNKPAGDKTCILFCWQTGHWSM